nr:MAG TPA: hypothetical protein [Caudoviricetes sp.]
MCGPSSAGEHESRKCCGRLRLSLYVPNGTTEGPNDPVPRLWDKPSELGQLCTMPTVRQRID